MQTDAACHVHAARVFAHGVCNDPCNQTNCLRCGGPFVFCASVRQNGSDTHNASERAQAIRDCNDQCLHCGCLQTDRNPATAVHAAVRAKVVDDDAYTHKPGDAAPTVRHQKYCADVASTTACSTYAWLYDTDCACVEWVAFSCTWPASSGIPETHKQELRSLSIQSPMAITDCNGGEEAVFGADLAVGGCVEHGWSGNQAVLQRLVLAMDEQRQSVAVVHVLFVLYRAAAVRVIRSS